MNGHEHHQPSANAAVTTSSLDRLALSATIHCLTGCAIGEVLGMVIGTALGWATSPLSHSRLCWLSCSAIC